MKKASRERDEMRAHYDFRGGVRGKYAQRYAEGTNVVVLDPDVAKMFPDRESVNEALRAVGRIVEMRERRGRTRRSSRPA
jgi:Trm5-related predicted tRNA methylase